MTVKSITHYFYTDPITLFKLKIEINSPMNNLYVEIPGEHWVRKTKYFGRNWLGWRKELEWTKDDE